MRDKKQRAVLEHLQQGGRLTVLTCIDLFRTTEMRKIATRLKKYGVISVPVPGTNYHEYLIPAEVYAGEIIS